MWNSGSEIHENEGKVVSGRELRLEVGEGEGGEAEAEECKEETRHQQGRDAGKGG